MQVWVVVVGAGVLVLVALVGAVGYNRLVQARNAYRQAFAQIDVQLARRHDLVPNLVGTAKGYLRHERQTLEAVVQARTAAVAAKASAAGAPGMPEPMQQLAGAENLLTQLLGQLFVLVEGYPQLKANQTMLLLTEELTSTENRVAFARQAYNDKVMTYNIRRQVVPSNLVAGLFGFAPAALFELADPQQRQAPQVSF
jgi:LemA protein